MSAERNPVVRMRGISVSFPGALALDGVDLDLYPGEVHALMGENGAGKSTLVKALTGAQRIQSGEIWMQDFGRISSSADASVAGISAAYQEDQLCRNLTIGENVMIGHEVRGRFGIDWGSTHRAASRTLEDLGLGDLDSRAKLHTLTLAEQQLVAIGRAVVRVPRVLVLDEPTSSLDLVEVARLFSVVRRLRDQGVAIVFISHFLEQIYAISDRITVLRDGRKVGEHRTYEIERAELISEMMGKDLAALRRIGSERRAHRREPAGRPVYRATRIGRRGVLDPMDIELHAGEIVGIAGLRGSGRSELAEILGGVRRRDSGEVYVDGRPASMGTPSAGLRHRVAFSTANRRDEGVIGRLSIRQNIVLALQATRGWSHPLGRAETDELVDYYVRLLEIDATRPDRMVEELSGGNQQKVLLARWLATHPRVLILDEPTRGIDVGAKVEIQSEIAQLAHDGVAVVFVSSEMDEVVRLSDRIVVLKDRRKIGELSNGPALSVDTIVELIAADPAEVDLV